MTVNTREFAEFLSGYVAALMWSSSEELDGGETSTQAEDRCRADCLAFFEANKLDIALAADKYPGRLERGYALAGHDFALTRNGHGAGYWDGDLPEELAARLTGACKRFGECWPYLGDDGMIYIA